jgi:transposase
VPIDPNSLPRDAETLRKIVVDLAEQLDRSLVEQNKYQSLLRELLEAQRSRKSEQLSKEQLALFEAAWKARSTDAECADGGDDDDLDDDAGAGPKPNETPTPKRGGRQPLARHSIIIHWSNVVAACMATHPRIVSEFFPPYAPELNPVDRAWFYIKYDRLENFTPGTTAQLRSSVERELKAIRATPSLLRSFIRHSGLPLDFLGHAGFSILYAASRSDPVRASVPL